MDDMKKPIEKYKQELIAEPEELFAPQFNEVPSFGEVQSEITVESRPEGNTLPREPVSGVTSSAPAVNYEERAYSSYAEFERENTRTGQLRFRTFTERGALPVKDAVCIVTKDFGGETQVLSTQTTDMSGQTEIISLPAPPRSLSQTPNNTILPYALYDATIRAEGFEGIVLKNIPIFEGILSVQNAALVPLSQQVCELTASRQ